MLRLLRKTGWVVGAFVVFDVLGVLLGLAAQLVAALDIVWEDSAGLGYAVWFVTGVFCATAIYGPVLDREPASGAGRREGTETVVVTALVASALGGLASLVWSSGESAEPVAPDHAGITITYLATTVAVVALARFALFRDDDGVRTGATLGDTPPDTQAVGDRRRAAADLAKVHAALAARERAVAPDASAGPGPFSPAGIAMTLAWLAGVPVLLFLDVSFFLLAPFEAFDRWTDPLLTLALAGGLAWGFAAARWPAPRLALVALHLPLLLGAMTWVIGLLLGALLVTFGGADAVATATARLAFWVGFILGGVGLWAGFAELFAAIRPRPRGAKP